MAQPYSALARRYRPQTFDEVIGQTHIAQALRNAIRSDRVAHGYIFTGARGVGKTSTARIFAKALNCPNAVDGVPCNSCEICDAISVGSDVDVTEMDGASNRGIDEIRQLRANANIRPMRANNKIYIIDEAHQLTKEAWNALLKTLEEPPPNVKFIFCTTEPEKLLDTVKSRCQRFDFSTVDTENIVGRLRQIAEAEGFSVEDSALELVARCAGGSMRDSQSLFDQLLAFGSDPIRATDVHNLLGTADESRLVALGDALSAGRPADALKELDATLASGVRIRELFHQLIEYFRDLMVLSSGAQDLPLLAVAEAQRETLVGQADQFGMQTILAGTQILAEAASRMNDSGVARPIGELALARIALLGDLDALADLITAVRSGASATPTGTGARRARSTSQKKTPELEKKTTDEAVGALVADTFVAGREDELLSQLNDRYGVTGKMHLESIDRLAIVGPNSLEVYIGQRYNASLAYFESPTGRSEFEEALRSIVGRPVAYRVHVVNGVDQVSERDDSTSAPNGRATMPTQRAMSGTRRTESQKLVAGDSISDPYVKMVMTVFESREARVKVLRSATDDS